MKNYDNLQSFTSGTRQICVCSVLSILIIVLFILSPLSQMIKVSIFMKIIVFILLGYTVYLNISQSIYLQNANQYVKSQNTKDQLKLNIICSYTYSVFLLILLFFVFKSFIY